jgi:hypothetical protein
MAKGDSKWVYRPITMHGRDLCGWHGGKTTTVGNLLQILTYMQRVTSIPSNEMESSLSN